MTDSALGLEHTLENTRFSPPAALSRLSPERMSSSPIGLSESHDLDQSELTSIRSLAAQKQGAGCYAEAEQLFRQALQIADRTLPADHPDVIGETQGRRDDDRCHNGHENPWHAGHPEPEGDDDRQ